MNSFSPFWILFAIALLIIFIIRIIHAKRREHRQVQEAAAQAVSHSEEKNVQRLTATENKLHKAEKELAKLKADYDSILFAVTNYKNHSADYEDIRRQLEDADPYAAMIEVEWNALSIQELAAKYRENRKQVKSLCASYQDKYTTKANATIYQLMVLALEAELQNIISTLTAKRLDHAKQQVHDLIARYYTIASDGNQTIAPTVRRFIDQLEFFYQQAVEIEYSYYVKKEQEKEAQREEREQKRQDARERRELAEQERKKRAEVAKFLEEIQRINTAIEAAENEEEKNKLANQLSNVEADLEDRKQELDQVIELQKGKAGFVYIISNEGAFGKSVFKIGMTRRTDPQERIDELGDASVPFPFDVHSTIFSKDAPALESLLHQRLENQRVNKVNLRKEFFNVDLDEIEAIVYEVDPSAEFHRAVASEQYRQSLSA